MLKDTKPHYDPPLGDLSTQSFLGQYWQRQPLLIRQAVPDFKPPLSPDELAGLACDADIESRIISGHPEGAPWRLRHGPFDDEDFAALGERDWTLLVQAVDHYVPAVAALRERFRFLPDWRVDDVMVSFAAPGGSVGPHYDQYDVFLLQGEGRRQWQIGDVCQPGSPLLAHDELCLLEHFVAERHYTLNPGDMLYLPPGVAHWGIALDPCTTYSIGFRAPSHADIISHYCDHLLQELDESMRYSDPGLSVQQNPGLIGEDVTEQLARIMAPLGDRQRMADWFARYMTEAKYPDATPRPAPTTANKTVNTKVPLRMHHASRCACRTTHEQTLLYVDGVCYPNAPFRSTESTDSALVNHAAPADGRRSELWSRFVNALCTDKRLSAEQLAAFCQDNVTHTVIATLTERGALEVDPAD